MGGAFAKQLEASHAMVAPAPNVETTVKRRSILHGQCYDARKCEVTVRAPKDRIVASHGSLGRVAITPALEDADCMLPSSLWASDHALVTSILSLSKAVS